MFWTKIYKILRKYPGTQLYVDFNIDLCPFPGTHFYLDFIVDLCPFPDTHFYLDFIVDLCPFCNCSAYQTQRLIYLTLRLTGLIFTDVIKNWRI